MIVKYYGLFLLFLLLFTFFRHIYCSLANKSIFHDETIGLVGVGVFIGGGTAILFSMGLFVYSIITLNGDYLKSSLLQLLLSSNMLFISYIALIIYTGHFSDKEDKDENSI